MTLKHLNFGELSDLIDNELSEQQREYCMSHITVCEICCREYESLVKCITLLSSLKHESILVPDFSERTILICRDRHKKRLFMKAVPAIAASVLIIAGAGFVRTGFFNNSGSYVAVNLTGHNETQRIIESVSNTRGTILQITHSYIDTEFDKNSLSLIERILHKNNIKHAAIINTGMLVNPSTGNMEDVNYTYTGRSVSKTNNNYEQNSAVIENGKVRLRIFK